MLDRKIFIDTHVHTCWSELDGLVKLEDYINFGKENNFPALFISDHGNIGGWIQFYILCKDNGIKPILGSEFYFSEGLVTEINDNTLDKNDKAEKENKLNFHLNLYAKNKVGYKNIIKLTTYANMDNFYKKPRITMDILKQYSDGLICTTSCIGSIFAHYILKDDKVKARQYIQDFKNVFKDDFYIEYGYHYFDNEKKYVEQMRRFAKEFNIKTIIGNDTHYLYKEDELAHKILMCKGSQTLLDESKFDYTHNFYKSYVDIQSAFSDFGGINIDECMNNTFDIINKVEDYDIKFNEYVYPELPNTNGLTQEEFLNKLVEDGLKKRFDVITPEIKERIDYELGVIKKINFCGYFNTVADYINWAKNNNIPVGTGRGSGAGSLVNYVIGITNVNPLEHDLLFERFLNPDRVNFADIDTDIETTQRPVVIEHLVDKYGIKGCVSISTRGYLKGKSSIKTVSSRLGLDFNKYNSLLSNIKDPSLDTVDKVIDSSEVLTNLYNTDEEFKKVIDISKRLEGNIQSISTHASAVCIETTDISDYVPIIRTKNGFATGWTDKIVEKIGLIKYDILGLSNLSVISQCCKSIGKGFDINNIPLDDEKTFKDLQAGDNLGKFQIESSGMKSLLKRLKPESIEHISAILALYRPGAMQFIDEYIENKNNPDKIKYFDDRVKPILEKTYGQIVYQEQVMGIARTLAGYTMGEADSLRKAIGKKIMSEMLKHEEKFINGCVKNGMDKTKAETLFKQIVEFAKYSFNASHSVSYAYITYQTAYLKSNYPLQYLTALLNNNSDDLDKVGIYINEAMRLGIDILPPDINQSSNKFTIDQDGRIRFGFNAIKGLGASAITNILKKRGTGYKSIEDFISKATKVNKSAIQSLLRVGAFNQICNIPKRWDILVEYLTDIKKNNVYPENIESAIYNRIADKEYKKELAYTSLVEQKRVLKSNKQDLLKKKNIDQRLYNLRIQQLTKVRNDLLKYEMYNNGEMQSYELELLGFSITTHPYKRWGLYEKYFKCTLGKNTLEYIRLNEAYDIASTLESNNVIFHTVGLISNIKKIITKRTKEEMAILTIEFFNTKVSCTLFHNDWVKIKDDINICDMFSIVAKFEESYNYGKTQDVEQYVLKPYSMRKLNVFNNKDNKFILAYDEKSKDNIINTIKRVSYNERNSWKPINKAVFFIKDGKYIPFSGLAWICDSKSILDSINS